MNVRSPLLLVVLVTCAALVQNAPAQSIDDVLTREDGMQRISDGLYARTVGDTESFVAVGAAGHRMLLSKLLEIRSRSLSRHGTRRSDPPVAHAFDELIDRLSAPNAKNQTVYGTCSGPASSGPLYAQALAGGGMGGSPYGASGYAIDNDSPPVNTANYASSIVYDVDGNVLAQQTSTQTAHTAAAASAYNAQGCTADAYATVTCPGHSSPSITAIAHNQRNNPQYCTIH